jgi:hypothetical protein
MYKRWILGMNGRCRRIVKGMSSCLFCPSPESTSMNLDDLHFGQYFASVYSFLNSTQPFGQACICSYVILSARKSFCASSLWQNVILRKQAANNRQQAIECVSTHAVLQLERHYMPNGIQLRNHSLAVKGLLLCRVKHVIECLCSRLWLVICTSYHVLCLVIVIQHIRYPRVSIKMLDALSQHLLSRTTRFTMKEPPSIAPRKSILPNMFYHGLL